MSDFDPNVETVIERHRQRVAAGLRKYGTDTIRKGLTTAEWLQHLQDELLEAAVYVERLKGEAGRARQALELLARCLSNADECQCIDPPEDREPDDERGADPNDPSAHSQYCPVYLLAVINAGLNGEPFPE